MRLFNATTHWDVIAVSSYKVNIWSRAPCKPHKTHNVSIKNACIQNHFIAWHKKQTPKRPGQFLSTHKMFIIITWHVTYQCKVNITDVYRVTILPAPVFKKPLLKFTPRLVGRACDFLISCLGFKSARRSSCFHFFSVFFSFVTFKRSLILL
jgi:hypothetical protein